MEGKLFSFVPKLINLIKESTLAKVIVVILLLFLVLVVILPLIRKVRRKRLKEREARDLLKDLMIWRHVAQLTQGGDEHSKAKKALSDTIIKINELLKQGFHLAALHGRGLYRVPWFMLLGEPHSGKSSLLEGSELELVPSAMEEKAGAEAAGEGKSLPVRLWLGGKAVVCDVSGAVFFDRWLEGSSAEWTYIIKQICRKHYRKPLDGVILTIPADALLADDGDLTRKKATLMANELAHLLDTSGMRLPCYVVVTKLDMVNGFREYALELAGELRHQILGYENQTTSYHSEDFQAFWKNLLQRLRSGYKKRMNSRDLHLRLSGESNRMDVTGKLFLFPENFDGLYPNLHIYLETLFSEDTFHGTKDTVFDGLFFTSSMDMGVSFSPGIAALAGKKTEDFFLTEEPVPVSQSYFVRDMLQKFIFNPSPHAAFVRKEALNRAIPLFALCGVVVILGLIALYTALFRADDLTKSLVQITNYYRSLTSTLQSKSGAGVPIIIKNRDATFAFNNDPRLQRNGSSPVQFYYNALAYRNVNLSPSFGFLLSDLLVFQELNMGHRDRVFIANQLYGSLIRTPLLKNVGSKLMDQSFVSPVLDRELRSVIQSFTLLDELNPEDFHRLFLSNQYISEAMIGYLLPELSNDSRSLLHSFSSRKDRRYTFAEEAAYIYSDDFLRAKGAALQIILSAWQRLSVYPDSLYGKIKNLLSISQNIVTNYARINFLLRQAGDAASLRDVQNLVTEWKQVSAAQNRFIFQGRALFEEIKNDLVQLTIPLPAELTGDAFGNNLINDYLFNDLVIDYAVKEYRELFQKDMEFIRIKSKEMRNGVLGTVSTLEREFAGNLTRELESLRASALSLKSNELLSEKISKEEQGDSLFMVVEKIVNLAGAVDIPDEQTLRNTPGLNWMSGQYDIVAAFDNYETYVKPFVENEKVSTLISNGRIMLVAQAYLNRYIMLNVEYDFLSSPREIIAAMVASRSEAANREVFSLSGRAIQSALGGIYFDKSYDPWIVKEITDGIAGYNDLFTRYTALKEEPKFLQNQVRFYQTESFSAYLGLYLSYWGNYPDKAYVPSPGWREYRVRVNQTKPYQINSVLQSLYTECIGILQGVNNVVLSDVLKQEKNDYITSLTDRIKLLSAFLSADADRMLTAWGKLPAEVEPAFKQIRSLSLDEIKDTYMTVYSDTRNISIGWWNDFIMNGIGILSSTYCRLKVEAFSEKLEGLRVFPLLADGLRDEVLSLNTLEDIALLLRDMGAGDLPVQAAEEADPLEPVLHPILFRGAIAQAWAQTIYRFAVAAVDAKKPLLWTLSQPPIDVQGKLSHSSRLLAVSRFRYIEVSTLGKPPKSINTYMNEKISLAEGTPIDKNMGFKFYRRSSDTRPAVEIVLDKPWSIFDFYLHPEVISTEEGTYFPIFLDDEAGTYVYFVEIDFNGDIPLPERWYTRATWPNFRITDGMVTVNR
ncbi:MAG: hypothetical protein LBU25_11315 [Treponema sp.]|jgi:hypothetical protein|nr:hypothetical protein [Treponema sp.]